MTLRPKPVFEPSIRRRPCRQQPNEKPVPKAPDPLEQTPPKSSPTILQPARPDDYNFRFTADRDFKDKFERLAEVLGVENAQKHMADILETALDIALDKKDPKKKLERRKKHANSSKAKCRSNEITKHDEPAKSRYIASEVSERVHARANYHANSWPRTGGGVAHARDFKLSMCDRLTTKDFLHSSAPATMD